MAGPSAWNVNRLYFEPRQSVKGVALRGNLAADADFAVQLVSRAGRRLLYDLVRPQQHRLRDRQAQGPRGFQAIVRIAATQGSSMGGLTCKRSAGPRG